MISSLLQAAEQAERNGILEDAFQLWTQLASEQEKPVYFCRLGAIAMRLGRWSAAEQAFHKALTTAPQFSGATEGLGALYLHRDDGDRLQNAEHAKSFFLTALSVEKLARTWNFLGVAYVRLNLLNEAKSAFLESIHADDAFSEAYFNLGSLKRRENEDEAKGLYEKAISLDPNELPPHQELGKLLHKQGDLEGAEKQFRRCLEITSTDCSSRLFLANNLAMQRREHEAEQEYRIAMNLCLDKEAGISFYANFLDSRSRTEEAAALRSQLVGNKIKTK